MRHSSGVELEADVTVRRSEGNYACERAALNTPAVSQQGRDHPLKHVDLCLQGSGFIGSDYRGGCWCRSRITFFVFFGFRCEDFSTTYRGSVGQLSTKRRERFRVCARVIGVGSAFGFVQYFCTDQRVRIRPVD